MNFNRGAVLRIIALIGGLIYLGIVLWLAIVTASKGTATIPTVLLPLMTAIGTALSLNFGAVLGLPAQATDKSTTIVAVATTLDNQPSDDVVTLSRVQVVGMAIYALALVIATLSWLIAGFSTASPQVIQTLAGSLIGVIAGVVVIVLQKASPPPPVQGIMPTKKTAEWHLV